MTTSTGTAQLFKRHQSLSCSVVVAAPTLQRILSFDTLSGRGWINWSSPSPGENWPSSDGRSIAISRGRSEMRISSLLENKASQLCLPLVIFKYDNLYHATLTFFPTSLAYLMIFCTPTTLL